MSGGRPSGPLRQYSVEFIWPSDPGRYRGSVTGVDEKTARNSATALRDLHYAFRVKMAFFDATADRNPEGQCVAAQWDRLGRVTETHQGRFKKYIPAWVTGGHPLAKEKPHDTVLSGS